MDEKLVFVADCLRGEWRRFAGTTASTNGSAIASRARRAWWSAPCAAPSRSVDGAGAGRGDCRSAQAASPLGSAQAARSADGRAPRGGVACGQHMGDLLRAEGLVNRSAAHPTMCGASTSRAGSAPATANAATRWKQSSSRPPTCGSSSSSATGPGHPPATSFISPQSPGRCGPAAPLRPLPLGFRATRRSGAEQPPAGGAVCFGLRLPCAGCAPTGGGGQGVRWTKKLGSSYPCLAYSSTQPSLCGVKNFRSMRRCL